MKSFILINGNSSTLMIHWKVGRRWIWLIWEGKIYVV